MAAHGRVATSPYLSGKLKLNELIARRIRLEEINAAFAAMIRGEIVCAIIVF